MNAKLQQRLQIGAARFIARVSVVLQRVQRGRTYDKCISTRDINADLICADGLKGITCSSAPPLYPISAIHTEARNLIYEIQTDI